MVRPSIAEGSDPELDVDRGGATIEPAVRGPADTDGDAFGPLLERLFDDAHTGENGENSVSVEVDGALYTVVRRALIPFPKLSPREHEIARMVAKGYTNKTIAAVLDISTWTVGTHVRRMFTKLDVHSRSALVARLAAVGEIGPDDTPFGAPWRD